MQAGGVFQKYHNNYLVVTDAEEILALVVERVWAKGSNNHLNRSSLYIVYVVPA